MNTNQATWTPTKLSCSGCGSTDREDLETGDQGYSACCNKSVS